MSNSSRFTTMQKIAVVLCIVLFAQIPVASLVASGTVNPATPSISSSDSPDISPPFGDFERDASLRVTPLVAEPGQSVECVLVRTPNTGHDPVTLQVTNLKGDLIGQLEGQENDPISWRIPRTVHGVLRITVRYPIHGSNQRVSPPLGLPPPTQHPTSSLFVGNLASTRSTLAKQVRAKLKSTPINVEQADAYATLRVLLKWLEPESPSSTDPWAVRAVYEAGSILSHLYSKKHPFAGLVGLQLRGLISPVDGSIQPFVLYIPVNYNPSKHYRFLYYLHSADVAFPASIPYASRGPDDFIIVAPHGRGITMFSHAADTDLLYLLDRMRKEYPIDRDYVYATGHSMGGCGSWRLAMRHPDLFAAIAPVSGTPDLLAKVTTVPRYQWPVENLLHVPVYQIIGANDQIVQPDWARYEVNRLLQSGAEVSYWEIPQTGHSAGQLAAEQGDVLNWLRRHRRINNPPTVRFLTRNLRYNQAYWVQLLAREDSTRLASIQCSMLDQSKIVIHTSNLTKFQLQLPTELYPTTGKLQITIDEQKVLVVSSTKQILLAHDGALWRAVSPSGVPLNIHSGTGPVGLFVDPIGIVYASGPLSWAQAAKDTADWGDLPKVQIECRFDDGTYPVRAEADLPPTWRLQKNLVVIGQPETSPLVQQIIDAWQVKVGPHEIVWRNTAFNGEDQGLSLVYPSPFNRSQSIWLLIPPKNDRSGWMREQIAACKQAATRYLLAGQVAAPDLVVGTSVTDNRSFSLTDDRQLFIPKGSEP